MPLKIVRNNIIRVKADAIVNTANPYPVIGSGVDKAIYAAAGREELLAARRAIGEIPPGQAAITPAFNLKAQYIIHAVTPRWRGGQNMEVMLLRSAYERIMELAAQHHCQSIAMPLLATGNNRFPRGISLSLAREVAEKYLQLLEDFTIYLVVYDRAAFNLAAEQYPDIESYLDKNYFPEELERCSVDLKPCFYEELRYDHVVACKAPLGSQWPEFMQQPSQESFSEKLLRIIDKKGLKDTEVYKKANIDRKLFSKIRKKSYRPGKKTAFALLLALKLNVDEATDLLSYAGIAFAPNELMDMIVKGCLENEIYNVLRVNEILFAYNVETLN